MKRSQPDFRVQARDAEGEVVIHGHDALRYLTFGNSVEQSCIDLQRPYRLVHVHLQAVMLATLLLAPPRSVLLLGLGGGSLAQALLAAFPQTTIDAVEHRALVVELAHRHLGLPHDPRLRIAVAEAGDFVARADTAYDLIVADLYEAEGMHASQVRQDLLQGCARLLTGDGVLAANFWSSEFRDNQRFRAAMDAIFSDRLTHLHVRGGNIIAYAGPRLPQLDRKEFFARAQALGARLAIPLQTLARNYWRQNAQVLQTGRYRGTK